jgi:threonylcarbamoyladenosine tRNA methylthiotransferase MtaB
MWQSAALVTNNSNIAYPLPLTQMSTFHVQNFGCRATQADGAAIEQQLLDRGLRAEAAERATVVVLNTCTVTAAADADARAAIRRIHRENPSCKILVTGCYAQRAPQEIAALPGVSLVIGNSLKHRIVDLAAPSEHNFFPIANLGLGAPNGSMTRSPNGLIVVGDIFAHTEVLAAPVFEPSSPGERTRPNLKVQDGCNNRCSFCVIPSVRGRSRSLREDEVVARVNALVEAGYREVVLSGINLGRWGRDLGGKHRFEDLVHAVLEHTNLEKLRLSSVEPMDWSDELINLMANSPRIAKHVHAPLQSGSDKILRAMHRKYRPWHYADRIHKARAAMPEAAIGADAMVGFPGETDALFEESRNFIESLPFTYLHVFTFSARPGTPAATMANQVPTQVARERNRVLRELAAEKNFAFRRLFVGKKLSAITLNASDGLHTEALTENYLKLRLLGQHAANQWVQASVRELTPQGLAGVVA